MNATAERAERHQEQAEQIAYDLETLCIAMAPNQDAVQDAARRGDLGEEMSALTRQAFERGEGSPRFRKLMGILQSMEAALVAVCLALCVVVPSEAMAWEGDLSNAPGWSDLTTSYDSLSGGERASADAYAQELLTNERQAAEHAEQLQTPLTYGEPSYQSPVHNFTAFGPNGTALKCTQTSRTVDCF
ncbi:MAG: hypothetical protein AABZ34_16195 [Nitrospirota bacterium]